MKTIVLEVRDSGTLIPVMATKLSSKITEEKNLLARAGFCDNFVCVLVTRIEDAETRHDHYKWPNRTMHVAHSYIEKNFDALESGDVVDVQYILGQTPSPKKSEINYKFGRSI